MTPDPLPVALPELEALDKPWRAWSGRINGKFAEVLVYNAEYIQARDAQMQAALRAQAEEVEMLRALLEQVRDEWYRFTPYSHLKSRIDAHLAASKQEKEN